MTQPRTPHNKQQSMQNLRPPYSTLSRLDKTDAQYEKMHQGYKLQPKNKESLQNLQYWCSKCGRAGCKDCDVCDPVTL